MAATQPTKDTFCVTSGGLLYEAKAASCSRVSVTANTFYYFKKDAAAEKVFTKEIGEESDEHVIYKGESGNKVSQVTGPVNVFDTSSKTLLACAESTNICSVTVEEGSYYIASKKRIVRCDGEACEEENKVGVYVIGEVIYKCTGTGTNLTCEDKKTSTCTSSSDVGKLILDSSGSEYYKFCKSATNNWVSLLVVESSKEDNGYRKLEAADAAALGFDSSKPVLVKVDGIAKYAVKVETKIGYYVNADQTDLTNGLIYCSADADVSKCNVVSVTAGYYALGGAGDSASTYIECNTDNRCGEKTLDTYDTCPNVDALPACQQVTNPNAVCRPGAVEGEVCLHTDTKLYESGKGRCFELRDEKFHAKLQYFNAKNKKILPQSTVTLEPLIYLCDKSNLVTCKTANDEENQCKEKGNGDGEVDYCIHLNVVYHTVGNTCVPYTDYAPGDGELLGCKKNENVLPVCDSTAAGSPCIEGVAEGSHCIDDADLIYVTKEGGCTQVTDETLIPDGESRVYYFDKEFKEIKEKDIVATTKIYARYLCENPGTERKRAGNTALKCLHFEATVNGDFVRKPDSVEMCLDVSQGKTISLTKGKEAYSTLSCVSGKFASISSTSVTIKNTGKSIVQVGSTPQALVACTNDGNNSQKCNNGSPVDFCLNGGDSKIYKTDGTKCVVVKGKAGAGAVSHYTSDNKAAATDFSDALYAYRCKFASGSGSTEAAECLLVKGYLVSSNNLVSCSGIQGDACSITTIANCDAVEDGKIGKDGSKKSVCVGGKGIKEIPTSDTTEPVYVAYKSTMANGLYGRAGNVGVLLEVGPSYAMLAQDYNADNGDYYFINTANPASVEGNTPLIKCSVESKKINDACSAESSGTSDSEPVKYYIDAGAGLKNVIKCTHGGNCVTVSVVDAMAQAATIPIYYINGTDGGIIKCIKGDSKCVAVTKGSAAGYYIDGADKKSVIYCDGENECISEKFVGVVANDQSDRTNEKYIQCNGSADCSIQASITAGSVLKFDTNTLKYKVENGEFENVENKGYIKIPAADARNMYGVQAEAIVKVTTNSVKRDDDVLPACDRTGYLYDNVCSGSGMNGANSGTHCLGSDNVIYRNTVIGSTKTCAPKRVKVANAVVYFGFKEGKDVTLDKVEAKEVTATYRCHSNANGEISKCTLVGNQLPASTQSTFDGGNPCFDSPGANDLISVTSEGALLKTTNSGDNCEVLTGEVGLHYFDNDYKEITDPAEYLDSIKFIYYCATLGANAALENCIPINGNIGDIIPGSDAIPKMRVSIYDEEAVTIGATTTAKYLKLPDVNGFPDGIDGEGDGVEIEIGKKGSITVMDTKVLEDPIPACKEGSVSRKREDGNGEPAEGVCKNAVRNVDVDICQIDGIGGTTYYETKSSSCQELKRTQSSKIQLYYDKNFKRIASPTTSSTDIKYVYDCEFASDETPTAETSVESCTYFLGYKEVKVGNSSYGLHCDGLSCKLESWSCSSTDYGKMKSGNVCMGGRTLALPTENDAETVRAFTSTEFNKYYGAYGIIFLKLTKKLVTLAAASDGK
ncbi:hypothetical protein PIROE2DRAFT_56861 [Piromyces sp. E2]|nr:hypothetical protein PIROE2DRAFT_56861 [Piromyces sp. E2]|eukprot:OUM70386.1 hypothetical protein PIROE2DRAFT_56861 [Piromyces sp. E2]